MTLSRRWRASSHTVLPSSRLGQGGPRCGAHGCFWYLLLAKPWSMSSLFASRPSSVDTHNFSAHSFFTFTMPSSGEKPRVIGIYGLPGSGKTFLLHQLKAAAIQHAEHESLQYYEGSEVIDLITPGGLKSFKLGTEAEMIQLRQQAIRHIQKGAAATPDSIAVVTGHLMFWPQEVASPTCVLTQDDLDVYTHIIYLEVPVEVIAERRRNDTERERPQVSTDHIEKWQQTEIHKLRSVCRENKILFVKVSGDSQNVTSKVVKLLDVFRTHNTVNNFQISEGAVRNITSGESMQDKQLQTMLVFDADKTLIAEDTGALFWRLAQPEHDAQDPLKALFSGPMQYSDEAFFQAAMLYDEVSDDPNVGFAALCEKVARSVTLRPEFSKLLQLAVGTTNVGALVVTCGLRQVWDLVLDYAGLSGRVKVIGGGRASDHANLVMTPAIKAHIVRCLQKEHNLTVWAFGDGAVDIPMLAAANHAIVVVGGPSSSMTKALTAAINNTDEPLLNARQTLLLRPQGDTGNIAPPLPLLDTSVLPIVDITDPYFLRELLPPPPLGIHHATNLAASKILATSHRDARLSGHALRSAHHRAGWYLALSIIGDVLGVEEIPGGIPHVQGHTTPGHHLLHEEKTLIIALMRGGEPMALGVSEAFPAAEFLHTKTPRDLPIPLDSEGGKYLSMSDRGIETVLLVDSVVNSGKSVVEFITALRDSERERHPHVRMRILVVAGVVQAGALEEKEGLLGKLVKEDPLLGVVALRVSENKFTGSGGTDTGNRLFNTTHLL